MTLNDLIEFYEKNDLSHDAPIHHRDLNYGGSVGALEETELSIVTPQEARKAHRRPYAAGNTMTDHRANKYGMVLISEPLQTPCD